MKKLILPLLLLLLAGAGYFYAKRQPVLFLPVETDVSDPVRYVLITEKNTASAGVFDLKNQQFTGRLRLAFTPKTAAVSDGVLFYAAGKRLARQDLRTGALHETALPEDVQLLTAAEGRLSAAGARTLYRLNAQTLQLQTPSLAGTGHIISLHHDLQGEPAAIQTAPAGVLRAGGAELLPQYARITAAAMHPESRLTALAAANDRQDTAAILRGNQPDAAAPLHAPLRPVIDAQGQRAYFANAQGEALIIDAKTGSVQRFNIAAKARDIALGLLDSRLIVLTNSGAAVYDSTTFAPLAEVTAPNPAGLFITSDSKTALFTGGEPAALYAVNLISGKVRTIALPKTMQPAQLFMGAGYTLCH